MAKAVAEMKVVLLSPEWAKPYGVFSHFAKRVSLRQPLNLAYLAAVTEQHGYEVRIIDGQAEGMSLHQMALAAHSFHPDIIGITVVTPTYHLAKELAAELKALDPKVPIAVGGPHISILKEGAFDSIFDYGFVGEAETSWPELLDVLNHVLYGHKLPPIEYCSPRLLAVAGPPPPRKNLPEIKGLLYRDSERVIFTGMPDPVDITTLPLPARHLLPMKRYVVGTNRGRKTFTVIQASRGCPFHCTFCATDILPKKVRWRTVSSVIYEMTAVRKDFGIGHFFFADDNLTLNHRFITELCSAMQGLDFTFEGSTRANLLDENLIRQMAKAGLVRLYIGLESAVWEIRRLAGKTIPLGIYEQANRLCGKYGVEAVNHIILGLPGETKETANRTIQYVRHNRHIPDATVSIAVPYPGTRLLEMAKKGEHGLKLETEDWSQYYRYGKAAISTNDLSARDLVRLQNDALATIYLAPWRWRTVVSKMGLVGLVLSWLRLVPYVWHRLAFIHFGERG